MRPIDADALKLHIKDLPTWYEDVGGRYPNAMKYPDGMFDCEDIMRSIENTPTITIDDLRPKGEWIVVDGFTCCNHCGCSPADWEADSKNESGLPPYCHSCGREMD